ncbi:acyl-CoA mutase large subunit family protein [Desulfotruncus alcoholivorax]|uniref:acyl-CoA mutase large subunit family protein n=1 Tax=Desulfotruncus alcoholivorax TaxID=265477 RepID=UPI000418F5F0|nr:acyl-CoA mutase large subunit family protein [Desulfotruncus alcoholivorax]
MERFSRSGIPVKDFYDCKDIGQTRARDVSKPGEFPFTRGRRAQAQSMGGWIQRELSGEGEPSRSNEQIKYLLGKGQMGIDIIGDSPTMAMLDPDHPLAANAVGTQGVSLCCKDDYLKLFKDIPLDSISISSSLPSIFGLTGLFLAAREAGIPPAKLRGSVIQAPFYSEDCGYAMHMPFDLRVKLAADVMEFCAVEMPKFHSFVEDTYFISESGLTAVEEMALGFVEIRYLVREMIRRGVPVDFFAPRIAILLNCSMDFFEEIAKIRATRRLFARMMKEEFSARDPRSWSVVITSHTSGLTLTAQQPFNNIIRGTVQALALVLAGVQALEISAFDEAYRTPSGESHLVGLRTQQVIELETGVTRVVDPLGGSYYVEYLTDEMEKQIWQMIQDIESKGDPAALSDKGYFRSIFNKAIERYARQVDEGAVKVVGVNIHQLPPEEDMLLKDVAEQKISPCRERIKKIMAYKESRDVGKVERALRELYNLSLSRNQNLVPAVLEATEAGATTGEMAGILRLAFGYPYDPHGLIKPVVEGIGQ